MLFVKGFWLGRLDRDKNNNNDMKYAITTRSVFQQPITAQNVQVRHGHVFRRWRRRQPVKVCGSEREVTAVHLRNARFPTLVSEFGSVREVREVHSRNATLPTRVKLSGSVREARAVQ